MKENIEELKKTYLGNVIEISKEMKPIEETMMILPIQDIINKVLSIVLEEVGRMKNNKKPVEGAPFTDYMRAGYNNAITKIEDKIKEAL